MMVRSLRAFSLVELSIVLVILGLLVGGVLSGQSLIRASELRAVTTEYSKYMAATYSFRDKYFALPGDLANATLIWGKGAACTAPTGVAATPGTCNGDASGAIDETGANGDYDEMYMFWQHLQLAGLIEGTYTGTNIGPSAKGAISVGVNIPRSKLSGGSWDISNWANTAGDTIWLNMGNTVFGPDRLYFGTTGGLSGLQFANQTPLLKPEEMWNIDTKMDDGKPSTGNLRAVNIATCTNAASGADAGIASAQYLLSSSTIGCSMMFDNNGRGMFN